MFYQSMVRFLKIPLLQTVARTLRRHNKLKIGANLCEELIRKYAPNKSFADVGCLWRVNGFYSFLAEECGAFPVVAVDISSETALFFKEKNKRNSQVRFVQGDLHLQETLDRIGVCDIIFCSGLLYHTPNPFHLLSQLRNLCAERLILNTALIPENSGLQNMAVFYPFLGETQRKMWDLGTTRRRGVAEAYEPENGYGNWYWGFTPSCLESMLKCAGFEVQRRYVVPFHGCYVCRPVAPQFAPVCGVWTHPEKTHADSV